MESKCNWMYHHYGYIICLAPSDKFSVSTSHFVHRTRRFYWHFVNWNVNSHRPLPLSHTRTLTYTVRLMMLTKCILTILGCCSFFFLRGSFILKTPKVTHFMVVILWHLMTIDSIVQGAKCVFVCVLFHFRLWTWTTVFPALISWAVFTAKKHIWRDEMYPLGKDIRGMF